MSTIDFNEVSFDELDQYIMELSFLLEDLLHRHIELVTPEALSPYIEPHILKEVEYVAFAA